VIVTLFALDRCWWFLGLDHVHDFQNSVLGSFGRWTLVAERVVMNLENTNSWQTLTLFFRFFFHDVLWNEWIKIEMNELSENGALMAETYDSISY
jgi:hypothetical protein